MALTWFSPLRAWVEQKGRGQTHSLPLLELGHLFSASSVPGSQAEYTAGFLFSSLLDSLLDSRLWDFSAFTITWANSYNCYWVQVWVCSLHDWPVIRRQGVEARNRDFIWKAGHPRRWQTNVLEHHLRVWIVLVQLLSCVGVFATPWTTAQQASLSFTISRSLLKLMSTESVMPSNHFVLCWPLLLLPSIFSSIWVFSNEAAFYIRWPKYWSFNFRISPSNEYSGLISFRIDWFDLLAVQRNSEESSMAKRYRGSGCQFLL